MGRRLILHTALRQQRAWSGVSRQSSAAKGNMGALPPMRMHMLTPLPDD
jgi:hypothetical protein